MSLINDALKRASKPGTPGLQSGAPMVPADPQPPDYGKLLLSVFVLIVLVLVAGTFFWWKGRERSDLTRKIETPTTQSLASAITAPLNQAKTLADNLSKQNDEGAAIADSIPRSKPAQEATKPVTAPVIAERATQAVTSAAAPASPSFPELKVNAIYFRLKGPTVAINGKTLKVGDEINGARVTQIQRNAVEVEFAGKKKTLTMH
jgi:hypothetical protein